MSVTFLSEYSRDPAKAVRRKLEELHRTDGTRLFYEAYGRRRASHFVTAGPALDQSLITQCPTEVADQQKESPDAL